MEDKELLKKLSNLKEIEPDNQWKKNYREILLSQISASRPTSNHKSAVRVVWESVMPGEIFMNLAKPVWVTFSACLLVMLMGVGGVYVSKNSKPGDSLYIAKIISEKAKFAMAFNERERAKLGVEFASNRAKEMAQVTNESNQSEKESKEKLEQLSQDFKKEISQVKSRLISIKSAKEPSSEEGSGVFGANLGKDGQRIEIAEPTKTASTETIEQEIKTSGPLVITENQPVASTTPTAVDQTDKMLEEAEKLFDEKNYDETISKLEEINKAIDQVDSGEVRGASEAATSTEQ